jgi:hypothetical protein
MNTYDYDLNDLFDGPVPDIEDCTDFFEALIRSRNDLDPDEDMHLQDGFCQMASCQPKFHCAQQNVLEPGNSSDGFSHSLSSDLLASAIEEIGDNSEFCCVDLLPQLIVKSGQEIIFIYQKHDESLFPDSESMISLQFTQFHVNCMD